MPGFIKLDKKILSWEWYQEPNVSRLFIHLLLTANYKETKWQGQVIKRGQVITGLPKLSKETGLTIQEIRTVFKKLINTGEISYTITNKFRLINICKYDIYQVTVDGTNRTGKNDDLNGSEPDTYEGLGIEDQQAINRQNNRQPNRQNDEKSTGKNDDLNGSEPDTYEDENLDNGRQNDEKSTGNLTGNLTAIIKEYKEFKNNTYLVSETFLTDPGKPDQSTSTALKTVPEPEQQPPPAPPVPPPKKNLLPEKQQDCLNRQKKFYLELKPFTESYTTEMLQAFFDYWREPNKSKTKMRYEMEKTWDLNLRLRKWEKNQYKFSKDLKTDKNTTTDDEYLQQRKKIEERSRQLATGTN